MLNWLTSDKFISSAYREANAGHLDYALTMLRRAIRQRDPNGNRTEALGHILYHNSRYAEAADAFRQAWELQPTSADRLHYLASAISRSSHWESALALLDKTAVQYPSDLAPYAIRCLLYLEKPDVSEAQKAFEKARLIFSVHPKQSHASMGLLQQCADMLSQLPPVSSAPAS